MCCKGFVKRVVPFFLTFAVGLFVASFFVSIALPNFRFQNRGWQRHRQCDRMREIENQSLREENLRLQRQLDDKDTQDFQNLDYNLSVPPPPLVPPAPRVAPIRR
jgi:hypothetical protein